jgi:hypothetical protein
MTMERKPGNTGWQPGHAPSTPRPPAAPPSKQGGVNGPGVSIQPKDPKHPAHEVFRWGQPASSANPPRKDPAFVTHQSRQMNQGQKDAPLASRNAKVGGR